MAQPFMQAAIAASFGCLVADCVLAGESAPAPDKPAAAAPAGTPPAEGAGTAGSDKSAASGSEPTYKIGDDGKVDFAVYEGFKRYHAECHTCHGPNGSGSTFAPALAETMKGSTYAQFMEVVSKGKASGEKAMPGFANNPNVMCYADSIYVYLKARADGKLKAGDDAVKNHEEKSAEAKDAEAKCMK